MPVLGVVGARGRLGSAVSSAATDLGWRIGLTADREAWAVSERPDAVVDASHRTAIADVVRFCAEHRVPLVHATSGLQHADDRLLTDLAGVVAVVRAPNLALGHHLQTEVLLRLAALMAERPDERCELSVAERHPTTKRDRLSATARALATTWQGAGGEVASIDSVRGGLRVSDHTVTLVIGDEELVVTHAVRSLSAPAVRAVQAAEWARTAAPGRYSMSTVYLAGGPAALREVDEGSVIGC